MKLQALAAEFVGTFALIFVGAGAAVVSQSLVAVAFAHGMVVLGLVYAFGPVSGTHINPAVTFGLWVARAVDAKTAASYVAVQLAGGIAGAFVLRFLVGADAGLGVTALNGISARQGVVLETILTFFLVNAVFTTAVSGKAGNLAGIAIGMTLVACILMGAPLSGASLNPARSLGPALASGRFADLWVYFVGPLLGAVAAALFYKTVLED